MEISKPALLAIIPYKELQRTTLTVPAALVITRRHFCSQMTTHNLCTAECTNCKEPIQAALQGLDALDKAEGMFVTRLRHQVAKALEAVDAQKEPVVKTNAFGEKDTSVDLFADLLTGLS